MQVIEEPFEDVGEQNANGRYDYYYAGVYYRFLFPGREFRARRYEQSAEAEFLSHAAAPDNRRLQFQTIPYNDRDFAAAAAYLRDTIGVETVRILLPGGYVSVDFARLVGAPPAPPQRPEKLWCFQCRAAIPEESERCPACGWTWR